MIAEGVERNKENFGLKELFLLQKEPKHLFSDNCIDLLQMRIITANTMHVSCNDIGIIRTYGHRRVLFQTTDGLADRS